MRDGYNMDVSNGLLSMIAAATASHAAILN